jgi:hypothetical protein
MQFSPIDLNQAANMPKNLNLTSSMAAAAESAFIAASFENGAVHIAFDSIDVYATEAGWITVRGGPHGFEEHRDLSCFKAAYALKDAEPGLLALAYDMEAMCELFLLDAFEADSDLERACWLERRDRCRAAIAASIAKSVASDSKTPRA